MRWSPITKITTLPVRAFAAGDWSRTGPQEYWRVLRGGTHLDQTTQEYWDFRAVQPVAWDFGAVQPVTWEFGAVPQVAYWNLLI